MVLHGLHSTGQWQLHVDAWAHPGGAGGKSQEEQSPEWVIYTALFLAGVGGILHGIAMAMKKHWGQGIEKYWLEWKWWVGFVTDGFAGFLIWPAMPIVSVQVLMPLVIVCQVVASYIIGLRFFGEPGTNRSHSGVICAIIGVVGLTLNEVAQATSYKISDFWVTWLREQMMYATALSGLVLFMAWLCMNRATVWAIIAGALEGIQFITSRALMDAWFQFGFFGALIGPENFTVWLVIALKISCVVGIIHTSQLGIEASMSRFAGIYLIASTIFICVYGATYFGDEVKMNVFFWVSAAATLIGIWLLDDSERQALMAQKKEAKDNEAQQEQKEGEEA